MYLVKLIKNGEVEYGNSFKTMSELNQWVADMEAVSAFGEQGSYAFDIQDISAQVSQEQVNIEALKFLADTDWKVLRHIRELNLSIPTSLSQQEYLQLEQQRAAAAASIVR